MNLNQEITKSIFEIYRHLRKNCLLKTKNKLTIFKLHLLMYVRQKKDVSIKNIAQAFGLSLPAATIIINKLVKEKLIKKELSQKDHRIAYLTLTKNAQNLIKQINQKKDEKFEEFLNKLSDLEKKTLINLLKKIINN